MVELLAKRTFIGAEGRINKGDTFTPLHPARALELLESGAAVRINEADFLETKDLESPFSDEELEAMADQLGSIVGASDEIAENVDDSSSVDANDVVATEKSAKRVTLSLKPSAKKAGRTSRKKV